MKLNEFESKLIMLNFSISIKNAYLTQFTARKIKIRIYSPKNIIINNNGSNHYLLNYDRALDYLINKVK